MTVKFKLVFAVFCVLLLSEVHVFSQTKELKATFDQQNVPSEQHRFLNYSKAARIPSQRKLKDTNLTNYVLRMRNNRFRPTKNFATSLSVKTGDTLHIEVSAVMLPFRHQRVRSDVLGRVLSSFVGISSAAVIGEGGWQSFGSSPPTGMFADIGDSESDIRAYVNWLSFDESFTLLDAGYQKADLHEENRLSEATQKLTMTVPIRKSGFVYVYLSNESTSPKDVHFDDFTVTQMSLLYLITEDSQQILAEDNQYLIPEN